MRSFTTLPVFNVEAGSNSRNQHSSSATGLCSTPRGTTMNSPSSTHSWTVAELHPEAAFHDQEQFVFIVMMMEHEFTFQLIELHMLSVELGSNVGLPVSQRFSRIFRRC